MPYKKPPRNDSPREERLAALQCLHLIGSAPITKEQVEELRAAGVDLSRCDVVDIPTGEAAGVLCIVARPEQPPVFADNVTGPCHDGCGRTIQWRPYVAERHAKLCAFCMLERLRGGRA